MSKERTEYLVHYAMALTGGFLGGYALINHHELFGNAQTSNLIHIVFCLVGTNIVELMYRLLDLALYFSGFACTVYFAKKTKLDLQYCSVFFNLMTVLILFWMPRSVNDYVFLAPVFFSMAFQWNSFKGVGGYASSTIFSTNNFRQFSTSLCEYFCDKEKDHLHKTWYYGNTLLSYHVGVVVAYLASRQFGLDGVLVGVLIVLYSGVMVCLDHGWRMEKIVKKVIDKYTVSCYNRKSVVK
ncbi:MAG: YoaK family protein [Eubacteriales bacterium]|nr:YoaK family protein [Eubacteriales bacterium]